MGCEILEVLISLELSAACGSLLISIGNKKDFGRNLIGVNMFPLVLPVPP